MKKILVFLIASSLSLLFVLPVTADAIPFNSTNLGYGSSVVDLVSQQNGHL